MFNIFKSDLNAILAVFNKAIAKLEAHAEAKSAETVAHVEAATQSTILAQAAAAEQATAMSINAKLKAIISGTPS